ncbi:cardiolipin synthase [Haloferula chungangensis]
MVLTGQKMPWLSRFLGFAKLKRRPVWAVFRVVLHLMGLIYSVSAVMSTRTPQGAIAWAISLNTIPVVAVPAWWIFGNSTIGDYASTRMVGVAEVRPVALQKILDLGADEVVSPGPHELISTLSSLSSLPVTKGNQVKLLVDGQNTFDSAYEAIDAAKDYVLVQFYIIRNDTAGEQLKERLISKARSGVEVYLIYDDYGSIGLGGKFVKELRDAGAHVTSFMDFDKEPNRFQINFRNHRKLIIVDGKVGFVGGHNVGDEYFGKHPVLTPWRDSHLRISGPAVICLQVPFIEDWTWATGQDIEGLKWDLEDADEKAAGDALAVGVPSGPADPMETCSLFFHACIHAAKERIWIATPYFVPDQALVISLQLAAARGVDVRVLIPDTSDSKLVQLSSFSYLKEMESAGVQIWRYQSGFMHQKVLLVDDDFASIGSANLDNRSLRLNFELMVAVKDRTFAAEVEEMLQNDFSNSRLATADDLKGKSLFYRMGVRVARLLAPIQ